MARVISFSFTGDQFYQMFKEAKALFRIENFLPFKTKFPGVSGSYFPLEYSQCLCLCTVILILNSVKDRQSENGVQTEILAILQEEQIHTITNFVVSNSKEKGTPSDMKSMADVSWPLKLKFLRSLLFSLTTDLFFGLPNPTTCKLFFELLGQEKFVKNLDLESMRNFAQAFRNLATDKNFQSNMLSNYYGNKETRIINMRKLRFALYSLPRDSNAEWIPQLTEMIVESLRSNEPLQMQAEALLLTKSLLFKCHSGISTF
eukprot:GHVP01035837.1.p1 GENE.GHVP01035837.1~~GHVP01035837.1.p1  ORF type:complete len:260 (-),score=43.05 GHVP01035837.1:253-1032(-)